MRITAARAELDADVLIARLPQWGLHYRPVTGLLPGQVPQDDATVGLSVHGLSQVGDQVLLPAFLGALAVAVERAAGQAISPHTVTPLEPNGEELTTRMQERTGSRVMPARLRQLLEAEPASWLGHGNDRDGQWLWDLTRPRFAPFIGVQTVEDYLARLDANLVGLPAVPLPAAPPPDPLALLDQLDHLDAEWRIRTDQRLVYGRRTASVGTLVLPVGSAAELEAACSALADVLASLDPQCTDPSVKGSLAQLDHRLGELLADPERRAAGREAVATLRHVVDIRVGQQHSGTKSYTRAHRPPARRWDYPPSASTGKTTGTSCAAPPSTRCAGSASKLPPPTSRSHDRPGSHTVADRRVRRRR